MKLNDSNGGMFRRGWKKEGKGEMMQLHYNQKLIKIKSSLAEQLRSSHNPPRQKEEEVKVSKNSPEATFGWLH